MAASGLHGKDVDVVAQTDTGPPASNDWLVEQWRLSAFLAPGIEMSDVSVRWIDITGSQPLARLENPQDHTLQEEGQYGLGHLILTLQPGRVDWLMAPTPPDGPTTQMLVLGDLRQVLDAGRQIASRCLGGMPPLSRLALGTVLLRKADDKRAAYRILEGYLEGVSLSGSDVADFLHQVNRRRSSSSVDGMVVNRLAKWSASTRHRIHMDPTTPGGFRQTDLWVAARLELDINTAPDRAVQINSQQALQLHDEFVQLTIELAQRGDIA